MLRRYCRCRILGFGEAFLLLILEGLRRRMNLIDVGFSRDGGRIAANLAW